MTIKRAVGALILTQVLVLLLYISVSMLEGLIYLIDLGLRLLK